VESYEVYRDQIVSMLDAIPVPRKYAEGQGETAEDRGE
jgi:hypothetical protein